jgi:hypothetical protein
MSFICQLLLWLLILKGGWQTTGLKAIFFFFNSTQAKFGFYIFKSHKKSGGDEYEIKITCGL